MTPEKLESLGHKEFLKCPHRQPWPVWIAATERMQRVVDSFREDADLEEKINDKLRKVIEAMKVERGASVNCEHLCEGLPVHSPRCGWPKAVGELAKAKKEAGLT